MGILYNIYTDYTLRKDVLKNDTKNVLLHY